jgi:hypothetical protein
MALKTILCTKKYLTSHSLKIAIVIPIYGMETNIKSGMAGFKISWFWPSTKSYYI